MAGQWDSMRLLCEQSPVPIALDEELIGVQKENDKRILVEQIKPQYLILKPSLLGGFRSCEQWISIASEYKIGWWITSALESNIGLNSIAQWTATLNNPLPQGLGTGKLFTNNFESPLELKGDQLFFNPLLKREIPF
jgi:O-succinylbenzoate synthase